MKNNIINIKIVLFPVLPVMHLVLICSECQYNIINIKIVLFPVLPVMHLVLICSECQSVINKVPESHVCFYP